MQTLAHFQNLKLLSHPQRLDILRYLMKQAATLSQLGVKFSASAAHIRHHVKILEEAGFVTLTEPPSVHNHLEKYYRATADAWVIQLAILPRAAEDGPRLIIASKDMATHYLIQTFPHTKAQLEVQGLPLNSLDGLVNLRQGVCQMATCHLKEPESGHYNRSYIRHLFPGQAMALISLYQREEGLIVQAGNPLGIRTLDDLARPEVRFINRERGSGIRLWLDQALKEKGIAPDMLNGYSHEVNSHADVAAAIQQGLADAGLGIAAAARALDLSFVPLFEEPYELVAPAPLIADPQYAPFFEHLNSGEFRAAVQSLDGYLVSANSGQINWVS